jgi:alkylation response protein AidB-like acyl-CoA dehydrogenase
MDLTVPAEDIAFRAEIREWLAANKPDSMPVLDSAVGFAAHRAWERRLFDARLAAVSWPPEYGGRGASLWQWLIFEEEYYRAEAPVRVSQNGLFLLAPTLFEHGTPDQRDRFLLRMARADDIWAQAWSEPGAGSDLAALCSTASRVDRGWRLNGQKIWSTRAPFADWCFGLFRSDKEAQRHRGLTYFLSR